MTLTFLLAFRAFKNAVQLRFCKIRIILRMMGLFLQEIMVDLKHRRQVISLCNEVINGFSADHELKEREKVLLMKLGKMINLSLGK